MFATLKRSIVFDNSQQKALTYVIIAGALGQASIETSATC